MLVEVEYVSPFAELSWFNGVGYVVDAVFGQCSRYAFEVWCR